MEERKRIDKEWEPVVDLAEKLDTGISPCRLSVDPPSSSENGAVPGSVQLSRSSGTRPGDVPTLPSRRRFTRGTQWHLLGRRRDVGRTRSAHKLKVANRAQNFFLKNAQAPIPGHRRRRRRRRRSGRISFFSFFRRRRVGGPDGSRTLGSAEKVAKYRNLRGVTRTNASRWEG